MAARKNLYSNKPRNFDREKELADIIMWAIPQERLPVTKMRKVFHLGIPKAAEIIERLVNLGILDQSDTNPKRVIIRTIFDLKDDAIKFLLDHGYSTKDIDTAVISRADHPIPEAEASYSDEKFDNMTEESSQNDSADVKVERQNQDDKPAIERIPLQFVNNIDDVSIKEASEANHDKKEPEDKDAADGAHPDKEVGEEPVTDFNDYCYGCELFGTHRCPNYDRIYFEFTLDEFNDAVKEIITKAQTADVDDEETIDELLGLLRTTKGLVDDIAGDLYKNTTKLEPCEDHTDTPTIIFNVYIPDTKKKGKKKNKKKNKKKGKKKNKKYTLVRPNLDGMDPFDIPPEE